jgi:hypothetical protein
MKGRQHGVEEEESDDAVVRLVDSHCHLDMT